jgi:hypothetical protein
MTGELEEEKMEVYVRLGIRLLYKVSNVPLALRHSVTIETFCCCQGALSEIEGARGATSN